MIAARTSALALALFIVGAPVGGAAQPNMVEGVRCFLLPQPAFRVWAPSASVVEVVCCSGFLCERMGPLWRSISTPAANPHEQQQAQREVTPACWATRRLSAAAALAAAVAAAAGRALAAFAVSERRAVFLADLVGRRAVVALT